MKSVTDGIEQLYTAYRGDVYRLVYMMTGDPSMSEDVTQDVFLTALQKGHTIRDNPRAWLLASARNKTLNTLKREKRSIPLQGDLPYLGEPSDLHFLDALSPLTPRQRDVVIYHILYGLPHKDTALILGMTHSAVRKQYERAITELRKEAIP